MMISARGRRGQREGAARTMVAASVRRPQARTAAALLLVTLLAAAFTLPGTNRALAITRDTARARAQAWVDHPVPYSQAKHHAGYRTDCSGYVSMCWATGTSWSTRSFHVVTHRIATSQLAQGDALLKKGYHIRLFYGWVDDAHTSYVAYEAGSNQVAVCRIHSIADDLAFGYKPTRYDRIQASPKPRNVLKNGSFDVWARSWGDRGDQPVWWTATGPWWQTLVAHSKSVYHTTHHSLRLLNPSGDPAIGTELSQTAPVAAGATYRLSAWARTSAAPAGVRLNLAYLNAAGDSIAETDTTGERSGIDGASFRRLSLTLAAPQDAVSARVTVRLAGGTSDASSGAVPGTAVYIDDVSMTRPQVTVGMRASSTTARRGKTILLSGTVTPTRAIGTTATVYVKKPGADWRELSAAPIRASGSSAVWRGKLTFKAGMPKGVYRFKTRVPGLQGYLGSTSRTLSVRLR